MAKQAHFLGIDVTLSGVLLLLLDRSGTRVLSLARAVTPQDDGSIDPQDWWRAVRTGVKELLRRAHLSADDLRSIGLSGPGDAPILLDREGRVLAPVTPGADPELSEDVEELVRRVGARNLRNLSGCGPALDSFAAKLLRIRRVRPRAWHDLAAILTAKDFLRMRLTGEMQGEPSAASRSQLLSPRARAWSRQLATALEVDLGWLPPVINGSQIGGRVSTVAARETGLQAGTPVVGGAGREAALAIIGAALEEGSAVVELGGAGALAVVSASPRRDPADCMDLGCHCLEGLWLLGGRAIADDRHLDWLAEMMPAEMQAAKRLRKDRLTQMSECAAEVSTGAEGLLLMPAGTGHACKPGALLGLDHRHGRGHLARAVLEGTAMAVAEQMATATALLGAIPRITLLGPGAASPLWCQMVADACQSEVSVLDINDGPARGAALLGALAVGGFADPATAAKKAGSDRRRLQPRKAASQVYAALLESRARMREALDKPAQQRHSTQ